jgi:transglutaminase-like putative cysteine protease
LKAKRLAVMILLISLLLPSVPTRASNDYQYTMTYTFVNKGTTPVNVTTDDLSTPLFLNDTWQTVRISSATPSLGKPYPDVDGNLYTTPTLPLVIQPGKNITFTVVYDIQSGSQPKPSLDPTKAGTIADIPKNIIANYTSSTSTYQSNNTRIASLAHNLTNGQQSVLGKLSQLVGWLNANITYDSAELPRYANETLLTRKGDCDDQAMLLVSMLRGIGIPSYIDVGVVFDSSLGSRETSWEGHLQINESGLGWHGWAMVYVPPWGWIPVDLTLIKNSNPLDSIDNAPEYSGTVVTAIKVLNQDYVGDSRLTHDRIVHSTIYVTTSDSASSHDQPAWLNPTVVILGVLVAVSIAFMLISARRGKRPETQATNKLTT